MANGWALPRSIRDNLRAWQFDAATTAMADARTVLAQHAALAQEAARVDLALPDGMRPLFEAGRMAPAAAEGDDGARRRWMPWRSRRASGRRTTTWCP